MRSIATSNPSHKGTAARTLRLYLTAAQHLLRQRHYNAYTLTDLDRTLRQHPGTLASLAAFTRHKRERHGWTLALPPVTARGPQDPSGVIGRFSNAFAQVEAEGLEAADTVVITRILQTAFALSPAMLEQLVVE